MPARWGGPGGEDTRRAEAAALGCEKCVLLFPQAVGRPKIADCLQRGQLRVAGSAGRPYAACAAYPATSCWLALGCCSGCCPPALHHGLRVCPVLYCASCAANHAPRRLYMYRVRIELCHGGTVNGLSCSSAHTVVSRARGSLVSPPLFSQSCKSHGRAQSRPGRVLCPKGTPVWSFSALLLCPRPSTSSACSRRSTYLAAVIGAGRVCMHTQGPPLSPAKPPSQMGPARGQAHQSPPADLLRPHPHRVPSAGRCQLLSLGAPDQVCTPPPIRCRTLC